MVQNLKKLEEDIESGALQPASAAPAAPVDNGMLSPSGDSGALYDSKEQLQVRLRVRFMICCNFIASWGSTAECSSPCWRIMRV